MPRGHIIQEWTQGRPEFFSLFCLNRFLVQSPGKVNKLNYFEVSYKLTIIVNNMVLIRQVDFFLVQSILVKFTLLIFASTDVLNILALLEYFSSAYFCLYLFSCVYVCVFRTRREIFNYPLFVYIF